MSTQQEKIKIKETIIVEGKYDTGFIERMMQENSLQKSDK